MSKIIVFGNSGSGKSTLAKKLSTEHNSAHLDLDTIAWLAPSPSMSQTTTPTRTPIAAAQTKINDFILANKSWVIEGCYADLLVLLLEEADEAIYLNLPVEDCINNAKARPWEPHKYPSKEAQDANLTMLINWITDYPNRQDDFSQTKHQRLFDAFKGKKTMYTANNK